MCLGLAAHALACSNVFVAATNESTGETYAAVARSMDVWLWGDYFGYGLVGDQNTANINIPQSGAVNAKQWTTAYGFIGQTAVGSYIVDDGVNTQGLYGGLLELPGFTQFPEYNPADTRPELGVMDVMDYALGTAKDIPDLVNADTRTGKLLEVQTVLNAGEKDTQFHSFAGHIGFRDKNGNSAIVEWIKGQMHIYVHTAGTNQVVEIIDGVPKYKKVYPNADASVLTNAPPYSWHLQSVVQGGYNKMFNGNTNRKWDGSFMNGSALLGCAGDYTPVARFLRGTTVARLFPKPLTQNQTMYAALSILQTIMVPLGANPEPSSWLAWVDLENSIYNLKKLNDAYADQQGKVRNMHATINEQDLYAWQAYDCVAITSGTQPPPAGWTHVTVTPTAVISDPDEIRSAVAKPTDGNFKQNVYFLP
jgi:penicillin V acylase-like amidase (Ntn superfamily)